MKSVLIIGLTEVSIHQIKKRFFFFSGLVGSSTGTIVPVVSNRKR